MSANARRAAIIGYGSIGRRHADVARELGLDVAILSRRALDLSHSYTNLGDCLTAFDPDVVIVANETSRHAGTIADLANNGFRGGVLIEKPLFDSDTDTLDTAIAAFARVGIAYPLRHHPLIIALQAERSRRDGAAPATLVRAVCGQHLSTWRPGTDYRTSYSARRSEGGGVLRDLSHELDLAMLLARGTPTRVTADLIDDAGLEIESDAIAHLLVGFDNGCSGLVSVDYLMRPAERRTTLITPNHTYSVDFLAGRLVVDGETVLQLDIPLERNLMYRTQLARFLDDAAGGSAVTTWQEARSVMRIIDAAERAARTGTRQRL